VKTKVAASQGEVWASIAKEQEKLSKAFSAPVAANVSASSYQLTLEHEQIMRQKEAGLANLRPLLSQYPKAIGWVFAIHGELNNADIYLSHDLFSQLWDKLLSSAVTESIAETKPESATRDRLSLKKVSDFLEAKAMILKCANEIPPRALVKQYVKKDVARFETEDRKYAGVCVHTNVLSLVS
jgi:hypothetical protein